MVVDLDNTHILYYTIPNYTLLYQIPPNLKQQYSHTVPYYNMSYYNKLYPTIPNTTKFETDITRPVLQLRVPNFAW